MNFFKHLYRSVWDIEWLAAMKDKPKKQSWGYFFLFMVFLVVFTSAHLFFEVPGMVQKAQEFFGTEVPSFTATFKDGTLSITDLEQPYMVEKKFQEDENILVYVDTSTTESLSARKLMETKSTGSAVLITKDRFEFYDVETANFEVETFSDVPDVSFTKLDIVNLIGKKGTLAVWGFLVILLIFIFIFWSAGKVLYLAVWSGIIALIVRMAKRSDWKFADIFRLGLGTVILPSVVMLIAGAIAFEPQFVYTIIFLVLTLSVIFRGVKKVEGGSVEHKKGEDKS